MSILNVVQPDEFSDAFETIDEKLQPKISPIEGNVLSLFPDGLYTPALGGDSVPGRYYYPTYYDSVVEHKGVVFKLRALDGALTGLICGQTDVGLNVNDCLYYGMEDRVEATVVEGESGPTLELPWGVEYLQRIILKLHRNDRIEMWCIAFTVSATAWVDAAAVTVIIDEM